MTPVDNTPRENMGGFELICSLKSNDIIPVHKYKSKNTGLTVFIAEVDGPIVDGYFCLGNYYFRLLKFINKISISFVFFNDFFMCTYILC